jgi:glycosyltransferase involved in cell wall biosynthesis
MGRSLIEAICCGTRVVVTDCGAIKEFINSKNGTLAENHENEFAKQIEYALSMPIIEESHRQNYLNAYSFENIFNQYETLWS